MRGGIFIQAVGITSQMFFFCTRHAHKSNIFNIAVLQFLEENEYFYLIWKQPRGCQHQHFLMMASEHKESCMKYQYSIFKYKYQYIIQCTKTRANDYFGNATK